MKMEHEIVAPAAGVLTALPVSVGDQVDAGTLLAAIEGALTAADRPALPLIPSTRSSPSAPRCAGSARASASATRARATRRASPRRRPGRRLAEKGFVGINIPREWGGGGMGMTGLAIVGEEVAAAGVPTLMLVVSSGDRRLDPRAARHRRAEREVAAGDRRRDDEVRVRDHRARRRHEHAQPPHRGQARRRPLPAERPEGVHLGGRGRRVRARDRADARRRRRPGDAGAGGDGRRRARLHAAR